MNNWIIVLLLPNFIKYIEISIYVTLLDVLSDASKK